MGSQGHRLESCRLAHEKQSAEARATADPVKIRQLYADYGSELREALGDSAEEVAQHGSQRVADWQAAHLALLAPPGVALDIGCGPRPQASMLLAQKMDGVVNADISWDIVAMARAVARSENTARMSFVVADAEHLPFRDKVFSVVVADDVIEHVPGPGQLLKETARVLRPEGVVSVSTPNRLALSVLVDRARDLARGRIEPAEKYYLVPSHLTEFTRKQLRALSLSYFAEVSFAWSGWDGEERIKRLCTRLTSFRPLSFLARHWIVLLRQPRHAQLRRDPVASMV
jgi:ubiquinone/menaquinone biosynthesis C-methylase UbiE